MSEFNGTLQKQAWMTEEDTVKVMSALADGSGESRFVGGCVRDALVNRRVVDIDIATTLTPEEVIERLKKHKIKYAPTGLKHGTVTAIAAGKPFEITTLRLDVSTFGRHAEVEYTDDWKKDAARRDFTINAMSATPEGKIFDPFGGIADLRDGRVVFVGDPAKRIEEDVLRILRFFRFYAHFGKGEPDKEALEACVAASVEIKKLSAERIRQEVLKLLEAPRAAEVWEIMLRAGVTAQFLPEAVHTQALAALIVLEEALHAGSFALRRLAVLLEGADARKIAEGLRLSNEQAAQLVSMLAPKVAVTAEMEETDLQKAVYALGNDTVRNLVLLAAARAGEKISVKKQYEIATSFRPPRFPLQGSDIMLLGWREGKEVGRILKEMESWWLEKNFAPGRTECLAHLKEVYSAT